MTDTDTTRTSGTHLKPERRPVTPYFDLKKDPSGRRYMEVKLRGIALLRLVLSNKGTAFTQEERISLELGPLHRPLVEALALGRAGPGGLGWVVGFRVTGQLHRNGDQQSCANSSPVPHLGNRSRSKNQGRWP